MPVHALESDVGVVLLELEVDGLAEVYVWSFDGVHVLGSHRELREVEIFRKHFHVDYFIINITTHKS